MEPNLILIFGFVTVALLVVMTGVYFFMKAEATHKERRLELQARIEEAKAQQQLTANVSMENWEDRLRVVERIVTDPSANLAREIEDLHRLEAKPENAR
ncbi:hypothetical protein [Erythrobacter sp. EC-HK427]|uniref:hypothetical protein n=1 Tax=Erythrobacter sp. EC-HK427 TaxID=2038396 RepID=UPI001253524A|nr:hypothetical protein [Erythrobacter sp. EC-HK427]VVS96803.1 conserved hypothetical protein [Erythrobacter sp. EC-HK427]